MAPAMPWWVKGGPRFDRVDWIRYGAAVVGAVAGQAVWMSGMPRSGNPWQDGLIGIGIVVVFVSAVAALGAAMFGNAKDRVTLKDIKEGQDEIMRLSKETKAAVERRDPAAGSSPRPSSGGEGAHSAGG